MLDPLLAAAEPNFDAGYFIGIASRLAHTLCASALVGGLLYLKLVLAPAVADDPERTLFAGRRKAWAGVVGGATLLLLVSGIYNVISIVGAYKNLPGLYLPLFGVKFLLALFMMFVMALVAGKTKLAERVRGSLGVWLNLALLAALGVYGAGAMLRSFRDLPDARVAAPMVDEAPAFDFNDSIELPE